MDDVVSIKIDVEGMLLGDVEILQDRSGLFSFTDKLNVLSRMCPNVDIRKIPVLKLQDLMSRIDKEMNTLVNPTLEV